MVTLWNYGNMMAKSVSTAELVLAERFTVSYGWCTNRKIYSIKNNKTSPFHGWLEVFYEEKMRFYYGIVYFLNLMVFPRRSPYYDVFRTIVLIPKCSPDPSTGFNSDWDRIVPREPKWWKGSKTSSSVRLSGDLAIDTQLYRVSNSGRSVYWRCDVG